MHRRSPSRRPTVRAGGQAEGAPHAISGGGRPRTAVVGILGGGQLGKMMAQAASQMGVSV